MKYQRDSINITAIIGGVAIILLLAMGFALKYVHGQNVELTTANGKLATQVTEVTEKNTALSKELELKKTLDNTASKESNVYEEKKTEITQKAEVQKRALPKVIIKTVVEKPSAEEVQNTTKRLDVLWASYCDVSTTDPICKPTEGAAS